MSEPRSTDMIVAELMRVEYGIVPASIVEGPRGWVGETFPTYEPHPTLCRYYLLRRYFEDIEGCLVKIIEGQSIEEQARFLAGMKGPLMDWLWPLIEGR